MTIRGRRVDLYSTTTVRDSHFKPSAVVETKDMIIDSKPRTLEGLAAEERFVSQLELVREHWASVRRLWLSDSDLDPGADIRSGLPPEFWIGCGMLGLSTVGKFADGRFEFNDDGQPAIVIPAYDTIPGLLDANAERHVDHIVDLVAVDLDQPDRHWRRRGEALILGAGYRDIAAQEDAPLPVYRNPLSWLKSCGDGIVMLDWTWAPDLLLGFDLIAEDVELGNRLEAAMRPEIWVMEAAA